MALLKLPQEILTEIYCNLSHTHDAINLAQTCTAASELLRRPLSCRRILQSIVSRNDRARQDDIDFSVMDKIHTDLVLDNALGPTAPSLSEFLVQFEGVDSESLMDTIIIKSARYQRKLMEESPSTATSSRTIIARCLHCLVIVSKIAHELHEKINLGDIKAYCSRLEQSRSNRVGNIKPLSSLLFGILEDLEEMIRRGTPKEWPIILTVLCIFNWMLVEQHREDHEIASWLDEIDTELVIPLGHLAPPLTTLTRMFYIQMRGNHPFRSSWGCDAYSKLVQGDSCATSQFDMLHKAWIVATCAEDCVVELDLDGNGYQRVEISDSFEPRLQDGLSGWVERVECFCHGPSFVFESYPPLAASLELWELKSVDTDCLEW